MEKMREEFEAWAASDGYQLDASSDARFTYDFHETECAWYGWQASRAAQCVELPDSERSVDCGDVLYRSDVEEALDAAGVRYT